MLLFILPYILFSFLPVAYVYNFRINTPVGYISPTILLIPIFVIFLLFRHSKENKFDIFIKYKRILSLIYVFIFLDLFSALLNGAEFNSLRLVYTNAMLTLGIITLIFLASSRKIDVIKLIKMSIYISTIVAAIGLLEFLFGFQPYQKYYLSNEFINFTYNNVSAIQGYLRRIVSTIGNPLILSTYLALTTPFILYLKNIDSRKLKWNIIFAIHALAILLTMSRTGIVLLIIVVLINNFTLRMSIKKNAKNFFAFLIIFISFDRILNHFSLKDKFLSRLVFESSVGSLTHRVHSFTVVDDILGNNPLMGLSSGSLARLLPEFGYLEIATLDNVYLKVLIENGLIGLVAFVSIHFALFIYAMKLHSPLRTIAIQLLLILVISGLSFQTVNFEPVWGSFWYLISLVFIHSQNKEKFIQ